jgi:hypothetical protein
MKTPPKFPVAGSTLKTFKIAPPSLFQTEGDRLWAEAAAADATRTTNAAMIRYMFFFSRHWVVMCRYELDGQRFIFHGTGLEGAEEFLPDPGHIVTVGIGEFDDKEQVALFVLIWRT